MLNEHCCWWIRQLLVEESAQKRIYHKWQNRIDGKSQESGNVAALAPLFQQKVVTNPTEIYAAQIIAGRRYDFKESMHPWTFDQMSRESTLLDETMCFRLCQQQRYLYLQIKISIEPTVALWHFTSCNKTSCRPGYWYRSYACSSTGQAEQE